MQTHRHSEAFRYAQILDKKMLAALLLLTKPQEAKKLTISLFPEMKASAKEQGSQILSVSWADRQDIPSIETKPWFEGEEEDHPRLGLPGKQDAGSVIGEFDPVDFNEEDFSIQIAQDEGAGAMETLEPLSRVSLGDCFGYPSGGGNERKAGDEFMNATTSLFEQEAKVEDGEQESSKPLSKLLSDDASVESFDEEKSILFYWRCAEGKGAVINDLTEYNLEGEVKGEEGAQWIMLNNGEPIEFQDKWGKRCPRNYGIALTPSSSIKLKRLTPDALEKLGEAFTIEFWFLHILEPDPSTPLFSLFQVRASSHLVAVSLNLQKSTLAISYNKNVVGECSPADQSIEPKKWHHIAIVWKFLEGKMRVILNTNQLSQVNISKDARKAIRGSDWFWGKGLQGLITEIRCWNINLSSLIVKENYRAPCSFVHDMLGKFKVKTKSLASSGLAPPSSKQSKGLAPPPSKKQGGGLMPPPKSRTTENKGGGGGLLPPPPRRKQEEESKEEEKSIH